MNDLTPAKVDGLLREYGERDGLRESDLPYYYNLFKDKKYCLLIFIQDVQEVEPFRITKQGYGAMAAWMSVPSVEDLRIPWRSCFC